MMRNFRGCGREGGVKECTKIHHFATKGGQLFLNNLQSGNEDVPAIHRDIPWFR
jgi:hypothetical protein